MYNITRNFTKSIIINNKVKKVKAHPILKNLLISSFIVFDSKFSYNFSYYMCDTNIKIKIIS